MNKLLQEYLNPKDETKREKEQGDRLFREGDKVMQIKNNYQLEWEDVYKRQEYKSLIHRLNRIEGQIRGIKGMVEKDVYCTDILVQVAAANAALNGFSRELLANHIRTCVAEDIRQGKDETIDELVALLPKLMK